MRILEHPNPNELVFEMINIDVSLANALRRIMIAEVPTMAIEHVYMWHNSSIVHDEVLSHRLGLVPLGIDSRYFDAFETEDEDPTDKNTIVFRMNVKCGKNKEHDDLLAQYHDRDLTGNQDDGDSNSKQNDEQKKDESVGLNSTADMIAEQTTHTLVQQHLQAQNSQSGANATSSSSASASNNAYSNANILETPSGTPYTKNVYSSDLQWIPQGAQQDQFPDGIRPIHEDILLAKLRPGQSIELEAHARKGEGKDHAKYSPVATACYRLMPNIELIKPVYDELAEELDIYEPGVFRIVPCTDPTELQLGHTRKAVVDNPYACTMSRNFMRNETLKEAVKITRIPNHFIFSVESVGMIPSSVILAESLRVLKNKCQNVVRLIDECMEGEGLVG